MQLRDIDVICKVSFPEGPKRISNIQSFLSWAVGIWMLVLFAYILFLNFFNFSEKNKPVKQSMKRYQKIYLSKEQYILDNELKSTNIKVKMRGRFISNWGHNRPLLLLELISSLFFPQETNDALMHDVTNYSKTLFQHAHNEQPQRHTFTLKCSGQKLIKVIMNLAKRESNPEKCYT